MPKRYRGLAFDFSGVLAPLDLHQTAAEVAYNTLAVAKDDERYRLTKAEHARAMQLGTELWSITRGLLALHGIVEADAPLDHPIVREAAEAKQREYALLIKDGIPPLPGSVGVVRWAQKRLHRPGVGGKLALASASPMSELSPFADQNGLEFDAIVGKEDVGGNVKPKPDVYLLAAGRVDLNPGDVIAVEDSVGGLQAARSAGCLAIGLPLNGEDLSSYADIVVPSYDELRNALDTLLVA